MITDCRISRSRSLTHRMNLKFMSVRILTIKVSQWAHMNFYSYHKNMYCDSTRKLCCFGKLLSMRGGCNQRLQSLLHLDLITAHNAHDKQHCQDIRDKLTCWYGSYLRTVATWQAEYIVHESVEVAYFKRTCVAFKLHNFI